MKKTIIRDPLYYTECSEEYKFSDKVTFIKGDKIKLKVSHGNFIFVRHVYMPSRDAEWLDVLDRDGQTRSFYITDIKGPLRIIKRRTNAR